MTHRLIDPNPKMALFLKSRKPLLVPDVAHAYVAQWMEDIGKILRSREYQASLVAGNLTRAGLIKGTEVFPVLSRFKILSAIIGV